jgi:putative solute:sodium symporter small subunit
MKRRTPRDRMTPQERRAWYHNVRWIVALLAAWFLVTFVVSWFARELRFDFMGWPFSFWMAAQGSLILYVLMAALYAWRMNRADDEIHAQEQAHIDAHPAPPAQPDGKSGNADPGTI